MVFHNADIRYMGKGIERSRSKTALPNIVMSENGKTTPIPGQEKSHPGEQRASRFGAVDKYLEKAE